MRWRRIRCQRITKGHHAGVKHLPRHLQRLFRLEHDGEFRQVEASDVHDRARTLFGRNGLGVLEGIPHLPEPHQTEGRWQVEGRRFNLAIAALHLRRNCNLPDSRFLLRIIISCAGASQQPRVAQADDDRKECSGNDQSRRDHCHLLV